jgi:type II secretory pathway pseudopilin PulG
MNPTHKFQGLAVVVLIIVAATTAFALPKAGNERGDKAWSDRMTGQAAHEQEQAQIQRAREAYAARMAGQTQSFEDLIRQVEATRLERANKAWSDRLTGLAQAEAVAK